MTAAASAPVLFAYDGSELAKLAIDEAGALIGAGRDAIVACVWQPFDVGFVPAEGLRFDAADPADVRRAAEQTAAEGASLGEAAGFRHSRGTAIEAASAWRGIIDVADEHDAAVIVLGSHGHTGLAGVLLGSVAAAVAAHSRRTVMITHRRS
ncbi:MAG TPA: universal stress protein [Solirubrobacteraceae bacterium]|jgi:nucleotide-binding universal stress UspA family protein|nr:universal stress protein [Solirubrobacteraceae bacterium]